MNLGEVMEAIQCPFCDQPDFLLESDRIFVKRDAYPVSPGHMLIIPKRHFANYFDCTDDEQDELWAMVGQAKSLLEKEYSPEGYNVGVNVGEVGGQTVPHLHVHLIPRYTGDMVDPRGGVRGVIPEKQKY